MGMYSVSRRAGERAQVSSAHLAVSVAPVPLMLLPRTGQGMGETIHSPLLHLPLAEGDNLSLQH